MSASIEFGGPITGTRIEPRYLGPNDRPWLDELLALYRDHKDRPRRALEERLREPLRFAAPPIAFRNARQLCDRLARSRVTSACSPREARALLFAEAARSPSHEHALARAADRLEVSPTELEAALFADLPLERLVGAIPETLSATELALHVNRMLVTGLLHRARRIQIRLRSGARDIVRLTRLLGLLCTVHREEADEGGSILEISGPLSLFQHTRLYGRALARVVPRLAVAPDFVLRAECRVADVRVGDETRVLEVRGGDPIFPDEPPEPFDSALERRFARDFTRAAPDWELFREPEALVVGERLLFPDFALSPRRNPSERWLLEIVGFWTENYLEQKLAAFRAASIDRLILCIDEKRRCDASDLPAHARVVRYRRRIDPKAVLAAMGRSLPAQSPS